jgi:hypothetical protein
MCSVLHDSCFAVQEAANLTAPWGCLLSDNACHNIHPVHSSPRALTGSQKQTSTTRWRWVKVRGRWRFQDIYYSD